MSKKMGEEDFRKFLNDYLDSKIESVIKAVMSAVITREDFHVHVSLRVYITKEKASPEGHWSGPTGETIVRDLRQNPEKARKLDYRDN